MTDMNFSEFNHQQDAGRSFAAAQIWLTENQPEYVEFFNRYVEGFACSVAGPVPGMVELIKKLKEADIRCLGLSNWSAENFAVALTIPGVQELDDVLVSGQVGLAKPDRRIYELLLQKHQLEPTECVFIDDTQTNIEAATKLGITSILFTDAAAVTAALQDLGLLPDSNLQVRAAKGSN